MKGVIMAISNAEAQRRWRQRQKEKRAKEFKQAEDLHWYVKGDFENFLCTEDRNGGDYPIALEMLGFEYQPFTDGSMPYEIPDYQLDPENPAEKGFFTGIGRAEVSVVWLIEAAKALSASLNAFKLKEIDSRIKEIEAAELTDTAAKKQALKDIVRLNKMRDQLTKQVRITLPQWKVTGE